MTALINIGEYLVRVQCPHCDRHVEVPCTLEQVLKVKGAEGSLTVALAAKAVPHNCDQEELPFEIEGDKVEFAYGLVMEAAAESVAEMDAAADRLRVDTETGEIHEVGRGVRL